MVSRRKKKWAVMILTGAIVLPPVLVLAHARARAVLRLVPGFVQLKEDPRVFYEPGAEEIAARIAKALPGAVARVQECQAKPFVPGFRVYVCSSHASFARHIGQSIDDPVRGIAFLWDIWVSPKAFSFFGRDTHRQTLAHELSHLHLGQHLGWWDKNRNLPSWFMEGLADWVADTGHETVSREHALKAFGAGRHLSPEASGRVPLPRKPSDHGLTWPMFHAQSRMFIEYLQAGDPELFRAFVVALLDSARFEGAFEQHFDASLEDVWQGFVSSLKTGL